MIIDKLKDLKNISFKEFVDIFIQINEESLKEMILQVESVNFDELKEKRRAFRKDHIKSVHEMFSAIMFIKK